MATEGHELLGVEVEFPAQTASDQILRRFGDPEMVANMHEVFFGEGQNALGHSYAKLIRGPAGRNDLADVVDLLGQETWTKRAVVTLCGTGNGRVPCINLVQFLVRDSALRTFYFARGQDAFRKFYADGLCVAAMARKVAEALRLPAGTVIGFIGSCHIYHQDLPEIGKLLEAVRDELTTPDPVDQSAAHSFPPPARSRRQRGKSEETIRNRAHNQASENGRSTARLNGGART